MSDLSRVATKRPEQHPETVARTEQAWPPPQPSPGSKETVAWRLALGAVGVIGLLVLVGLLLTHLPEAGVLQGKDLAIDRWFAAHRSAMLGTLTMFGSGAANTQTAIAVAAVAFVALRWWLGRWYESWVVVTAIIGELLIFLAVTAIVHRPRPAVPRLDVAPPTSSFPSGHTGAAVALYGCLAFILFTYARRRVAAAVIAVLLCLVPLAVGVSRLYRGMHFPSDVVTGALGGALWLAVVLMVLMPRAASRGPRQVRPRSRSRHARPSGS